MTIKYFQSNQTGAPQLSGQRGTLIAVLNACLGSGFNLRTLTAITATAQWRLPRRTPATASARTTSC
ncbi:hypothetical protein [Ralstonia pseudosolanacearum]|uniref:hypothetical protein n=1 Tax=Ralstonia pseudosolanacearum TaxID=1310165 RepID=UPI001F37AE9A|nr:hypothetical protein [Ralstonia pseudosolanacearum]